MLLCIIPFLCSVGGTGPLRVGAEFLRQQVGCTVARYSEPGWSNHGDIFLAAGFTDVQPYLYWDQQGSCVNFPSLISSLKSWPPKTVVILHAQAHNPTGVDPRSIIDYFTFLRFEDKV